MDPPESGWKRREREAGECKSVLSWEENGADPSRWKLFAGTWAGKIPEYVWRARGECPFKGTCDRCNLGRCTGGTGTVPGSEGDGAWMGQTSCFSDNYHGNAAASGNSGVSAGSRSVWDPGTGSICQKRHGNAVREKMADSIWRRIRGNVAEIPFHSGAVPERAGTGEGYGFRAQCGNSIEGRTENCMQEAGRVPFSWESSIDPSTVCLGGSGSSGDVEEAPSGHLQPKQKSGAGIWYLGIFKQISIWSWDIYSIYRQPGDRKNDGGSGHGKWTGSGVVPHQSVSGGQ